MPLWNRLTSWLRPNAATVSSSDLRNPALWLTTWAAGGKTLAGTYVSPEGALALSAYYACLRCISEDVGKLPLITYKRLQPRGKERAPDHPLYSILHDFPNPDMESMTFRETLTHHCLAWGNGYAEIERDDFGDVAALHVIHPSRVTVRRNESGQIVYDVHVGEFIIGGERFNILRLRQENMLHIRGLGIEGLEGYSVARLAAESLGITLAAQNYGAGFFGNSARPSGVLTYPGKLNDDARKNIRESWERTYGGSENAGKVALLEEDLKFQAITIPPETAQFIETRQFQIREICRWFRMPPHKIADLADAKWANIESQNLDYVTDTLMPWLTRWEQQIQRKLFGEQSDFFAEHLVLGLLRGDQASRAQFYKEMFGLAAMSPNDIREAENFNPIGTDGDEYFVAANNYQPLSIVLQGDNGEQAQETQDQAEEDMVMPPGFPARNGTANGVHHG